MTDDDHQGIYRVDIDSGAVVDVGSATPADGEGEGIDAATTSAGNLHVTVTDANHAAVTLDHLAMSGEPSATPAATPSSAKPDTSWPPALDLLRDRAVRRRPRRGRHDVPARAHDPAPQVTAADVGLTRSGCANPTGLRSGDAGHG